MTNNDLLMQFQADILGSPVAAPVVSEMTATGAAYAAGLATNSGQISTSCARITRSPAAGSLT